MSQREYYDGQTVIDSDPTGLIDRDNRNHQKKYDLITEVTHAQPGDALLEVGCGHGIHAERYAQQYRYTGLDLSASLCAMTRERVSPPARIDVADAMRLPYTDSTFDAVVGTAVLHHLSDQAGAIEEWQRVVRDGGSITLMEPNYLFPKDFVTAHLVPEERHKTGMAPWRLQGLLDDVAHDWELTPHIYTPPWPQALVGLYDRVDALAARLPGARWGSQMLRIHITC